MTRVLTKREMAKVGALAAAALAVTSCTQAQLDTTEKQFADLITQIQANVKAACQAAGTFVPTANSVLDVLVAILGTTSVVGVTASVIQQAVQYFVGAACPAPAPQGHPQARGPGPHSVSVNGKSVNVSFY
jgi:hypothetical protein